MSKNTEGIVDTWLVVTVDNKKKAVCNGRTQIAHVTPCGKICTHKLTCSRDPKMVFFLCKDCVIKYFYNLLENELWKLDSAEIKCHY